MMKCLRATLFFIFIFASAQIVRAQCNAAFTSSVSGATATFTAPAGPVNSYHYWTFGDGTMGYGNSPAHTYGTPGTYTVMHFTQDSLHTCADSAVNLVTLNFVPACHSAFTYTGDSTTHTYVFTPVLTPQDTIVSYTWYLDGTQVSTAHTYSPTLTVGSHLVCLIMVNNKGCASNSCQTVIVSAAPVQPPACVINASFYYTASAANPRQFGFTPAPNSSAYSYYWTFGDAGYSQLAQPTHTYASPGTYLVALIVTKPGTTCRDTVWRSLTIAATAFPSDSCIASMGLVPDSAQSNLVHLWVGTSVSNSIVSQVWSFTNLNPPYDSAFAYTNTSGHVFTNPGTYMVCVTLTLGTGCVIQLCDSIVIANTGGRQAGVIPSYPNPATNRLTLQLPLTQAGPVMITIYNAFGTAVYAEQKTGRAGENIISLPVERLSRGQYYIDIQYGSTHKKSRFQKL